MMIGTRFEELRDKILMKKPTTFQDLMLIAHKYVELDAVRRTLTKQSERAKQDNSKYRGKKEEERPRTQRFRGLSRPFDFTPLNRAPVYILSWMKQNPVMFNTPRRMDPDKERDKSKYYRFHEGYGHDTDRCWDLKREIEQLIQSGVLRKFVHEKTGEKRKGDTTEKEEQNKKAKEVAGVIHVIDGGERYNNSKKKKRNRRGSATIFAIEREIAQEVSFGPEDGGHVRGPHNDALVIEAVIRNHLVKGILIDE
ncbi:uncharacterized protein LOC126656882 [Mercurialis annua]|uniref:uncharacterized protein LOC126656882 n=1 Tax=Mercurialis annua TaxID=3986 RepID=UPI00215E43E0|nr:uncharacterized protein LOC126656882 [Mercurialis annua]